MPGIVTGRIAGTIYSGGPPLGTVFQTMDGGGHTLRALTHPDVWGINAAGTPAAGGPSLAAVAADTVMTGAQKNAVYDALYDPALGIGLTRVRSCEPTTSAIATGVNVFDVENPNDNVDPNSYNAAGFNFAGPRLTDLATYVKAAASRTGVALKYWQSPIASESWMTGHSSATPSATDVAEYAEWLLAQAREYAAQSKPLSYISIANEPSYTRNAMSAQFVRDVIKNLAPRLNAEGLLVPFVLPDDIRSTAAASMVDTVMADATAAGYVGAFATHPYDEAESNMSSMQSRATTYSRPLWQTEMSTNTLGSMPGSTATDIGHALAVHNMLALYNCTAVDYMMGAFGQQEPASLVTLNYAAGAYTGFTIRRVAYYFGQFWRYVRPGDKRVSVSTTDPNAKVTCFWRSNGARVVVAVNATGSPITTTITAADLAGKTSAAVTRSSGSENWAAQAAQAISGGAMTVTLPATSVSTFVA
jgi:O-glycosyl hydrolase